MKRYYLHFILLYFIVLCETYNVMIIIVHHNMYKYKGIFISLLHIYQFSCLLFFLSPINLYLYIYCIILSKPNEYTRNFDGLTLIICELQRNSSVLLTEHRVPHRQCFQFTYVFCNNHFHPPYKYLPDTYIIHISVDRDVRSAYTYSRVHAKKKKKHREKKTTNEKKCPNEK